MRYVLLIGSDDKNAPPPTQAQMDGIIQGHMRFGQELHASGKMVVGERLRPDTDASRIRVKAGHRQVMDGPFAETKEALGGFYLIEAATKEEAVEWGKKIPLLRRRLHRRRPRLGDVGSRTMSARGIQRPRADTRRRLRGAHHGRLPPGVRTGRRLRAAHGARHRHGGGARPGGLRPGAHQLARGRDTHPAGRLAPHDGAAASARSSPPEPAGRGPRRRGRLRVLAGRA